MAQNYECMLLLAPNLAEEDVQTHLEQFTSLITERGGESLHTQVWGQRRLEYPIAGQTDAIYAILHFRMESAGDLVEEFERRVRITDELLREMTIKVDELKIVEQAPPLWSSLRSQPRPGRGGRPSSRRYDSGARSAGPAPSAEPPRAGDDAPPASQTDSEGGDDDSDSE